MRPHVDALAHGAVVQARGQFVNQGAGVEGAQFEIELFGLDFGEVENIIDEPQQEFAGVAGDGGILAVVRR